ncbi:phenylacetate--CoA ligase family protein [Flindersiella endophytica]
MTSIGQRFARESKRALQGGREGIALAQREHFAEAVAHARAGSPYYRELYHRLPDSLDDPRLLPVTDKQQLMARFDDWVTDPEITREKVEAFVADPSNVGDRFLGKYLVATSSGTSGLRGLYILDERSTSIEAALGSRAGGLLGLQEILRMATHAGRTAIVTAPGGHFYSVAGTARFQRDHPHLGKMMRLFSIDQPLPEMVEGLNRFNPAVLSGFLGMLLLLANEQEAGRLHIKPALVIPGGETSTIGDRERLASVFGAKVRAAYAATECGYLGIGCSEGWYHVSTDWVVLEPVDADFQPVPAGELSHTVLLSNLVNQVQPYLRYNLGDSVLVRPDPCPCGSIFPAVRVQGRAVDLLDFPTPAGESVTLSPMHFGTLLDKVPGVGQFQVVQTDPATLRVRLRVTDGANRDGVWQAVHGEIGRLLTEHKAGQVSVEFADELPEQTSGGKFRRVIPLAKS